MTKTQVYLRILVKCLLSYLTIKSNTSSSLLLRLKNLLIPIVKFGSSTLKSNMINNFILMKDRIGQSIIENRLNRARGSSSSMV